MTSVLDCDPLHTADWQRVALFWHLGLSPPSSDPRRGIMPTRLDDAPSLVPAARVALYRNPSASMKNDRPPVFIDGLRLGELRDSSCIVVVLGPGRHRITVGTGAFWQVARRDLDLVLAAGQQAYVEFFVDDAVNNSLLDVTRYGEYKERVVRLVQRPMLTSVAGCSGVPTISLDAAQLRD